MTITHEICVIDRAIFSSTKSGRYHLFPNEPDIINKRANKNWTG